MRLGPWDAFASCCMRNSWRKFAPGSSPPSGHVASGSSLPKLFNLRPLLRSTNRWTNAEQTSPTSFPLSHCKFETHAIRPTKCNGAAMPSSTNEGSNVGSVRATRAPSSLEARQHRIVFSQVSNEQPLQRCDDANSCTLIHLGSWR